MANYYNFLAGFNVQSTAAIDKRLILTKAEMLTVGTGSATFPVPDIYLCLCSDDGKLYLYNKNNPIGDETGKYVLVDNQILSNERFTSLETKVGDAESGLVKDVTKIKSDVTEIQGNITTIQGDVTQLRTDVNVLIPEVAQLKEEVEDPDSGLAKRIEALETRTTTAEQRMTEIEARIAAIKLENIPGTLDGGVISA